MTAKVGTWRLRRESARDWKIQRRCSPRVIVGGWNTLGWVYQESDDEYFWQDLGGRWSLAYCTKEDALAGFKAEMRRRREKNHGAQG